MTCLKIRQKNANKGSFKWELTVQTTKKKFIYGQIAVLLLIRYLNN